jgi:hypothetical protein
MTCGRSSPASARVANRVAVAAVVATLAFFCYTRTLLPGVDLGDTGGFQAAVLWPSVSARQAYPLYYTLARPFVRATTADDPARGLNLFSALAGAAAVGLLVVFTATVTRSLAAGAAAGLFLAFSYTFWSQAIIAEVYTLHLALVAACLLALAFYARTPGADRLAIFFGVYAVSFGNHLTMILLFVPFTLFLWLTTPEPRTLLRPRIVGMALLFAVAGALQYWQNLMSVAWSPDAPPSWGERLAAFWFDATKSDWRESMVLGIGRDQLSDRLAMWWFDARQQFGVPGLVLAVAGGAAVWRGHRVWAITLLAAFATVTVFALTYNVGDTHVFFLPAHLVAAFFAGASISMVRLPARIAARAILVFLVLSYVAWRGWSTYPVMDRHDDRRGERLIAQLTLGISDPDAMLVSQMNWQLENVLLYIARYRRPDLTWTRLGDVLPHFPFLLADQRAIAREVVLTSDAAAEVAAAYGPFEPLVQDPIPAVTAVAAEAARIPRGTPYVVALLTPPRDETLDEADFDQALRQLTGDRVPARTRSNFELMAGLTGEAPLVYRSEPHPFSIRFMLVDEPFTVRMESWLPTDTFRRAGFGHVLHRRRRVQILERGVNLVWLRPDGETATPLYAASLFAAKPRFRMLPGRVETLARQQGQGSTLDVENRLRRSHP